MDKSFLNKFFKGCFRKTFNVKGISRYKMNKTFDTVLDEIFSRLLPNRHLEDAITRSILSEDMIADEASPALADIRRKIRVANNKIKDTLQSYVGGNRLKYLQENIVTIRNGRYVIPVRAECRNEIKGLVHDTSSSGATLFVEPMSVVEANNELKSLSAAEEREIGGLGIFITKKTMDTLSYTYENGNNILTMTKKI